MTLSNFKWPALKAAVLVAACVLAGRTPYSLPAPQKNYAGVVLSLARQEHPDTSAYNDPEIVMRIEKKYHAGFVVKSALQSCGCTG